MRELQLHLDVSQQCCINAFCSKQAHTVQAGKSLIDTDKKQETGLRSWVLKVVNNKLAAEKRRIVVEEEL